MADGRVRVALIGAGMAGRAHAHGYRSLGPFFHDNGDVKMIAVADANEDLARDTALRFGFDRWTSTWEEIASAPDVDAVSVALPNFEHRRVVEALIASGKHVLCDKPLALTSADALALLTAAKRTGVVHAVGFNCRRWPAVAAIRGAIEDGRLGDIRQFTGRYLTDYALDRDAPFIWRYARTLAGGGALIDIGAHLIDTARFLLGDVVSVEGSVLETYVTERRLRAGYGTGHEHGELGDEVQTVDTDDVAAFNVRFERGAVGQLAVNRMATGYRNSLAFDVIGEAGSASFDSERPAEFRFYEASGDATLNGFRRVVAGVAHPYLQQVLPLPADGVGHGLGETFIAQAYEFVKAVRSGDPAGVAGFGEGYAAALVSEAAQLSAEQHRAVLISEMARAAEASGTG